MVRVLSKLHDSNKHCSGCFACESVCSGKAITINLDSRGFYKCSISPKLCKDCGRCTEVCPQVEYTTKNTSDPECYAFAAGSDLLSGSSSGGAFITLAKWIIMNGGYVCGAVYDDDMNVVYKVTNDSQIVDRMRGSKYVLSEMRGVYGEVSGLLKSGKTVLFSGLPCHVAALKNYVGDNQRLYTIDLLCAGTPSKMVYKQYLKEISKGRKITNLSFRDKSVPYGTLVVDYKDGEKESREVIYNDPYFQGFNRDLYKDASCMDCRFAPSPRPGDMTIGDFWEYDKLLHDYDGRRGLSCVVVNNENGREMLEVLRGCASFIKKVRFSFLKRFNRFNSVRNGDVMSPRLYYMLDRGHSVSKSVTYCLKRRYDVGLTGFWRVLNYGGDLTYYALYHVILDLGLEPVMIEACDPKMTKGSPLGPTRLETKYPWYNVAPWYTDIERQREINHRVYTIMVGSDQVWNPNLINSGIMGCYTLDFAVPWRNTVAYSSSFGKTYYVVDTPEKENHVKLLKRINHVSVRESSGVDICAGFGIKAKHVLDPVMLCDVKHYKDLVKNATITYPEHFALCFVRHVGMHLNPLRLSKEIGKEVISMGGPDINMEDEHPYLLMNARTVENWMKALMECEYVVTDSFHAVAVAIVLKKPFIAIYGNMTEDTGIDRFVSLLKMFKLESRLFKTSDEAMDAGALTKPIDFGMVGRRLEEYRKDSLRWLKDALEMW